MTLRLLIVEPDRALLDTYRAYFDRFGLDATTANNGKSAQHRYCTCSIDLVILEPDLPDDSNALLGLIAQRTMLRPLPVIVVSRRQELRLDFPVQGYHVKPVSMAKLLQCVRAAADLAHRFAHADPLRPMP